MTVVAKRDLTPAGLAQNSGRSSFMITDILSSNTVSKNQKSLNDIRVPPIIPVHDFDSDDDADAISEYSSGEFTFFFVKLLNDFLNNFVKNH